LAATACALAAGVPLSAVAEGLTAFAPVKGRSRALPLMLDGCALILVDDSYNANPDSVRAAIDVLAELPAPRLLVLGDMGEVGDRGQEFHTEIGAHARQRGIEQLVCTGVLTRHAAQAFPGARHHVAFEALLADVQRAVPGCGSVLVKGSRFMKMERVVEAIGALAGAQATAVAKEKTCS
jgi:UDP-N-acetylmuramoyl-tripeptide--D-alanyl-D-alanine ligase